MPRAANDYETSIRLGRLLVENVLEEDAMKKTLLAAVILLGAGGFAVAQTMPVTLMSSPPPGKTVTRFYKQSVYDPAKDKIGTVDDVIVNDRGQISGLIIGVGGFLGVGEKDVAVVFNAVHAEMKDGAWYLTLDTTKDALKSAPGLTFDKQKTAWVPAT
jgi:sporulation protein YlmC with PRC-barrel domain